MARVASARTASSAALARSSKRKQQDSTMAPTKGSRQEKTPAKTPVKSPRKSRKTAGEIANSSTARSTGRSRASKSENATDPPSERRLRRFRDHPPISFQQRLERAVTQRMFVVGQTVDGTDEDPELKFDIVGSTGNIYKTIIGKVPTCSCPDATKGNQCKHICYVLVKVLSAPSHLQYQLAFLSSEIREIYEKSTLRQVKDKVEDHDTDGKRKPIEGDCPICFMEFEPKEDIVWCRAACGNNIHKTCFQKWAATSNQQGVRCVYCRSPWQNQDADGKADVTLDELVNQGRVGADGYINVASQMGLSGERDSSTYYQPWARRRLYYSGWRSYDDDGFDYDQYA
ncbi:RING finger protein [Aspergillus mulundensis]|uniref:RING finger protein n=1 Tax=Aspergillus mulundensis TaxID=1810919 RepID=A0A3D8QC82_9EURO|nr:hypothetical protein DSM5745_11012 [Aspergillus mulundensis]RDW59317.1 hypothetical protein DSM5745_11012 [Aspergillus mulundensis]